MPLRISLISRAVLREIWPPFLLGFAAYTFILLIRTILLLADFAVRRSAPFTEVARLVALSLPWIVVLTVPMAFLLGVLVGLGRLNTDSELTALRSCGIGPAALYRPVLGAAAVASALVLVLYNVVLPSANHALQTSMARVAATSIVNVVAPRTFREPRPGITFYFDRAAADGRSFEGVFLRLADDNEASPNRIITARHGSLALEGDLLWLDLRQSAVHEIDPQDPERDRVSRNETQRLLLAGDPGLPAGARVRVTRGLRSQTLPELWSSAQRLPPGDPNRRLAWVEIHKKFAIPVACIAFALIGVPLSQTLRRGGRGGSFALSLAVLLGYYVLLSSGETWAQSGRMPAALAMWLPNLLLVLLGVGAILWRPAGRAPHAPRPPIEPEAPAAAPKPDAARRGWAPLGLKTTTLSWSRSSPLHVVSLLDRYVLARFLSALLLVFASAMLLAVVVDYADKLDEVARHRPPLSAVLGFYRYFGLSIAVQVAPFAVLLATLIGLGVLSKNAEDTAFKASGVSLWRLAVPVVAFVGLGAVALFAVGEYVLPVAEQRQMRFRNVIYGRSPDYGIRTSAERNWYLARDGAIWYREDSVATKDKLLGVSVFRFDSEFQLAGRTDAREALWKDGRWTLTDGWIRTFAEAEQAGDTGEVPYRRFVSETIDGDPPESVVASRRRPEEMRFRELERLNRQLRAGGYPTSALETALQAKLAQPALLPIMAVLAVPFAFRVGRRGALAGIGVGLVLGILTLVASAFMTKLGEVGALPPALAAWSPNILFGLTAAYLLIRIRT
jgi:LPS export ABC transporter permease LptG/LPS export ABC transporter permease LptF